MHLSKVTMPVRNAWWASLSSLVLIVNSHPQSGARVSLGRSVVLRLTGELQVLAGLPCLGTHDAVSAFGLRVLPAS